MLFGNLWECMQLPPPLQGEQLPRGLSVSDHVEKSMVFTLLMFNVMITPRPTAKFSVDLTGAKLFLQDTAAHQELIQVVSRFAKDKLVPFGPDRSILFTACIRMMLRSLTFMYSTWSSVNVQSQEDVDLYRHQVNLFRQCWIAMGWKSAVWIHWVCAHSSAYLSLHSTINGFTSIPTEHRHKDRFPSKKLIFYLLFSLSY
jgi:hypothetical protein